LRDEAARAGVGFRFEAAAMDGAPVFNLWHYNLPGVKVLGFTGALNSTSKVVVEAMERGGSFEDGLKAARAMGITEADGGIRRGRLGLRRQDRRSGQRADGRAHHPAAGLDARALRN